MNPILVEAMRGGIRESAHRGAIAVVDADGTPVASLGDIERPVFPRSAVKVLQALPLVASGAADQLGLSDEELAVACASHNGEPEHTAVVARMLARAGLDADALECGAHWPYREPIQRQMAAAGVEPSALHNNCSGKHAGFLCVACRLAGGVDLRRYARGYVGAGPSGDAGRHRGAAGRHRLRPRDHGAGHRRLLDPDLRDSAAPPRACLRPHRHRRRPRRRPCRTRPGGCARAVARHPFMVGGTGRFDTRVMERLGERVFCKVGAEAVFCAAFPERGLGVAIKVDDGNNARAAEVAMAAAIEAFVSLDDGEAELMRSLSDVTLRNWNGIEVGALRASEELRRLGQG